MSTTPREPGPDQQSAQAPQGRDTTHATDTPRTEPGGPLTQARPSPRDPAPSGSGPAQVAVDPTLDPPARRGVSGTVWAALIAGVVVLILLLVFILQNNVGTHFEYMAWSFSLPLGVAMLLSAIAGALIMALVGSVRIFTLGRRLRKLERERERIKHTLGD